jgi:hypothetical protein
MSGSAAAFVNTQVLTQEQAGASSSSVTDTIPSEAYVVTTQPTQVLGSDVSDDTTTTIATSAPEQTTVPEALESQTAAVSATPAPTAAPATAPATTPSTAPATPKPVQTGFDFAVGNAGKVRLDTAGGALTIAETSSSAGWIVSKIQRPKPTRAEIWFTAAGVETKFSAELANGTIYTSIESRATTPTTSPVPTTIAPTPTTTKKPTPTTTTQPREQEEERDDD